MRRNPRFLGVRTKGKWRKEAPGKVSRPLRAMRFMPPCLFSPPFPPHLPFTLICCSGEFPRGSALPAPRYGDRNGDGDRAKAKSGCATPRGAFGEGRGRTEQSLSYLPAAGCPGGRTKQGETKGKARGRGEETRGKGGAGAGQGERLPLLQSPPRGAAGPAGRRRCPPAPLRPCQPGRRRCGGAGGGGGGGREAERRRRRRGAGGGGGEGAVGARARRAAAPEGGEPPGAPR